MPVHASSHGVPRRAMDEVSVGYRTKSDKIRALSRAGYSRAEIANFLGIRYQHVRNVLVHDERAASVAGSSSQQSGRIRGTTDVAAAESGQPFKARVEADGRVAIPPAFRVALGLSENDPVILTLENDEIRLMSLPASVRRAQAIVRQFVPAGVSLVDELLEERRQDAQREDRNA